MLIYYLRIIMKPPLEPKREDCCNSGCNPCIFDVYEKQLKKYKKFLECCESSSEAIEENGISEIEYTSFIVVDTTSLSDSHILMTLKKQNMDGIPLKWKPGQHFLFKYNSEEKGCTRAYTPIKFKIQNGYDFAIIIKRYQNGFVSNYLCSLGTGDETLWRGPYGNYEITPNKFSRIIMIAQGTGIVPFISIIEKILDDDEDMTKIILLYCCQSIGSILFRDELYDFKSYWNFSYQLYISKTNEGLIQKRYQEPIISHKLSSKVLDQLNLVPLKDQFLLCGSEQFMEYYKLWLLERNIASAGIILF